ncbi:MAG: PAS domain S-box protein [Deltaproteobacteria bacterium]|nr:PAS domain S-box protein [Deltaproteobacteria bacterium]
MVQLLGLFEEPAVASDATGRILAWNDPFVRAFEDQAVFARMEHRFTTREPDSTWDAVWRAIVDKGEWSGALCRIPPRLNGSWKAHARLIAGERPDVAVVLWRIHRLRDDAHGHYREAFASSPTAILFADLDGRVIEVNRAFCGLWRISEAHPRLADLSSDLWDNAPSVGEIAKCAAQGKSWSGEVRGRRADGSGFPAHVFAAAVPGAAGEPSMVTMTVFDLTQSRATTDELRASRERLQLVVNAAPVVLWAIDRDGVFTLSEGRELSSIGLAPGQVVGSSLFELYADVPDTIREARCCLAGESFSSVGTYGPYAYESRHEPLRDAEGHVIGAMGVAVNITERKRAEAALARVKESLDNAQRIAKLGNWDWNPDSDLVWWSDEIYRLLDLDIGAVTPGLRPFMRFVPDEDRESLKKMIGVALASEKSWHMEHRLVTATGRDIVVRHWTEVVRDERGKPLRLRGVIQDITEIRKLEQEQGELRALYAQSQKLDSVGRLAGGVAHDFNNLITTVRGYTDLLLRDDGLSDDVRTYVDEIRRTADRAASLSRRLLTFSRREEANPRVVEIDTAIEDASRMVRRLIGENIQLELGLGAGDSGVLIDPVHLDQIVINLAVNARDAMSRGGQIRFETGRVRLDAPVGVVMPHFVPGDYVRLRVADSGSGIAPEHLDKIFEPFFTTKVAGEGTGLGLATVYGLVTQSRGMIDVTSRVGVGTTFVIHWPVATHREIAEPEPVAEAIRPGGRILLVEDEDGVRRLTSLMLKSLGFSVTEAASGVEVLHLGPGDLRTIDLLMTDIVLPYMNGRELYEKLRPALPDLRVMYVSGYPLEVVTKYGIVPGADVFISKPFTMESLQNALSRFFRPESRVARGS